MKKNQMKSVFGSVEQRQKFVDAFARGGYTAVLENFEDQLSGITTRRLSSWVGGLEQADMRHKAEAALMTR
jgi:hypothetical protein